MFRKKARTYIAAVITIVLGIIQAACVQSTAVKQYKSVNARGWDKDSAYCFSFEIEDSTKLYDINILVRNNNFYPFQNLWLTSQLALDSVRHDTTNIELADQYGEWKGSGITLFHSSHRLISNQRFENKDTFNIYIKHGMNQQSLKGIQDLGISVEPVQ